VMIAIGSADLLFAVDSIPAIFGLTQETYLVFTANAFSLLGLRQLYFLVDGLLDRLVYLNYGLAAILGFIGIKLMIHALHTNELPFINGGEHVEAIPEISTGLSLTFIVVVLAITTFASLARDRRDRRATIVVGERNPSEPHPSDPRPSESDLTESDRSESRDA
jgi:tellurite resistance protein TerC